MLPSFSSRLVLALVMLASNCSMAANVPADNTLGSIRGLKEKDDNKDKEDPDEKDKEGPDEKDKEDPDKNKDKEEVLMVIQDWADYYTACSTTNLANLYAKDSVLFPSLPGFVYNNEDTFGVSIPPGHCWVFCDGDKQAQCPSTCVDSNVLGDFAAITGASIENYYSFLCSTLASNNADITSVTVAQVIFDEIDSSLASVSVEFSIVADYFNPARMIGVSGGLFVLQTTFVLTKKDSTWEIATQHESNFDTTVATGMTTTDFTIPTTASTGDGARTATDIFDANNVVSQMSAPPGFGPSSFLQPSGDKTDMYFTPELLFGGREVLVSEVASMSFYTNKPTGPTTEDWFFIVYTKPFANDVFTVPVNTAVTARSWFYGSRFHALVDLSQNLNAPANTWNQWSTSAGTNQLTFAESTAVNSPNSGIYAPSGATFGVAGTNKIWTDFIADPTLLTGTAVPAPGPTVLRSSQTISEFSLQTSSGSTFTGGVDGLVITLTDGSVASLNFGDP
jgi:hypothetical protein